MKYVMKTFIRPSKLALLSACLLCAAASTLATAAEPDWAGSLVQVSVARSVYDPVRPWVKSHNTGGMWGVVVGERKILTLAVGLEDNTLLRVQKDGRGKWWDARVVNTDIHAGLGLITVEDGAFWEGVNAMPLADTVPVEGSVGLCRWENGQPRERPALVKGTTVSAVIGSFVQHMKLRIAVEADRSLVGQAIVKDGKLVGIAESGIGPEISALPADYLRFVMEKVLPVPGASLGFIDFKLQYALNPALTRYLGIEGGTRGAIVMKTASATAATNLMAPRDIILKVDGYAVDSRGEYRDPIYGFLSIANLSTRNKLAGDTLKLEIWRNGATSEVEYRLPAASFNVKAVPRGEASGRPEYLLAGGALFLHLSQPYLAKVEREAPLQLMRRIGEYAGADRKRVVILSRVYQDEYCLGFAQYANLVVEKVNDRPIGELRDVAEALKTPIQGKFHVIEFARNRQRQRIVLDAAGMPAATRRVLERYGIPEDRYLGEWSHN